MAKPKPLCHVNTSAATSVPATLSAIATRRILPISTGKALLDSRIDRHEVQDLGIGSLIGR